MKSLSVKAPAKLNLTLTITGRRADGYHLLDSLFIFCGLHDLITVEVADGLSLSQSKGGFVDETGSVDNNLVIRAARLLQAEAGIKTGAKITLQKNIPVAAGLGGGSADAAATLNALNQLWGLNWSQQRLEAIAEKLGADVPACVKSKPVIARGIGDELSPAPEMPKFGFLLVNPRLPTPTPDVFKAFKTANPRIASKRLMPLPAEFADLAALIDAIKPRGNDLLDSAIQVQPAIADLLEALRGTRDVRYTALSGSGATCFALYDGVKEAKAAGEAVQMGHPGWWVWAG